MNSLTQFQYEYGRNFVGFLGGLCLFIGLIMMSVSKVGSFLFIVAGLLILWFIVKNMKKIRKRLECQYDEPKEGEQ